MPFRLGLGCDCCPPPCRYSLCVQTVDRCTQMLREGGVNTRPRFVATTVTFDGPGGEQHVVETGGGELYPATVCLEDPAPGEWTITAEADGWQTATTTVTVVECESQGLRLELCPTTLTIPVTVTGCLPPQECGPILVSLSGPGVITPAGSVDLWDQPVAIPKTVLFTVDLTGVALDADCVAAIGWTATVSPPSGLGLVGVSGSTQDGSSCAGGIAIEIPAPEGKVCICGPPVPEVLDFSDDWGECELVYGDPCCIGDWRYPDGPRLDQTLALWVGSYSFTCEDACTDAPCYGGFGVFTAEGTVTVTVVATCNYENGSGLRFRVYKFYEVCPDCTGAAGLRSVLPSTCGVTCRLEGVGAYADCGTMPAVSASGAWVKPFQLGVCSGDLPGYTGTPCVLGNWTLTG